jgi:hypothetical protein
MRESCHVHLIRLACFVGRIIFDFMTNAIVIFGPGRLFHYYRFPEVDGCPIEESRAHIFVHCNLPICTNSRIERCSNITMHYAQRQRKKDVIDVL